MPPKERVGGMITLFLLRHAKSSWADPGLDDYERPLAKRGVNAGAEMGKYLKRQKLRPDLILCSGAVRTRATLELVLAELGTPAPMRWPWLGEDGHIDRPIGREASQL